MSMRRYWLSVVGLAMLAARAMLAHAAEPVAIDLTYDSVMDMVRPNVIPGLKVHHNLHVTISQGDILTERRTRNARAFADKNATAQIIERSSEGLDGVSWRLAEDGTLVREQFFPQSIRTMTVTFLSERSCHLHIVDRLKPGFTEYEFLRISTHTMAYFSTYVVVDTSCRIR
jgi:hypothetical protein